MRLQPRENPLPFFAALCAALLVLCIRLAIGEEGALASLPLVLLLVALVFKRYPGEQLIEQLARHFRRRRRRPVSANLPGRHATPFALRFLASIAFVRPQRGPPLPSSLSI